MSILMSILRGLVSNETNANNEYGERTYRSIMNASRSDIDNMLKSYGYYNDYKNSSRLYIAEKFRQKAKDFKKEYIC